MARVKSKPTLRFPLDIRNYIAKSGETERDEVMMRRAFEFWLDEA